MIKSPFKFLDSYAREDRDIFFGRDQEIAELYRRVFESKLLLVYGISGTGKSSLINCGLASRFDDSDWLPVNIRRGSNIIESFEVAINKQALTPLKNDQSISEKLKSIYLDHFKPIFLIFDQFEELFIFGKQEEKADFINQLKEINGSKVQCRIILVIREEFLAGMTEFELFIPTIFQNRVRIEKMSHLNALEAIKGPCNSAGITLEEGFAEKLLEKLSPQGADIELTYLQVFLDNVFRSALEKNELSPGPITFSHDILMNIRDVSDLLGSFLDEQIKLFEFPGTATRILKTFVTEKGTKRQMSTEEVREHALTLGSIIQRSVIHDMLQKFVNTRILNDQDENGRYELLHDALAAKIFEKITLAEKERIEIKKFIDNAYEIWKKRKVLLNNTDLEYIKPQLELLYVNREVFSFLEESRLAVEKAKRAGERAKVRKRNLVFAISLSLIIILSGFSLLALLEKNRAIVKSNRSRVLMLISKAIEYSKINPTKAVHYARLALKYDSVNAVAYQTLFEIFNSVPAKPLYSEEIILDDNIQNLSLSPDGKGFLTCSSDGRIKLWNLTGDTVSNFIGQLSGISFIQYSPDGNTILTSSRDRTIRLWNKDGKCLETITGRFTDVCSVRFSHDGKYFLISSGTDKIDIWDIRGRFYSSLSGHSDFIGSALFSPASNVILTLRDNTARLWDISGKCLNLFSGHSLPLTAAMFSPDGRMVLTGSMDNTAKLWNVKGNCVRTFSGHTSTVNSVEFSPNSEKCLTASGDKTAKLWDLSGRCLATLSGHSSKVTAAIFSPDGKFIATSSEDKTVKIWNTQGDCLSTLFVPDESKSFIIFSYDGEKILTIGDNKVKIWSLADNMKAVQLWQQSEYYSSVISPDREKVLCIGLDSILKLVDLNGSCLVNFKRINEIIKLAAFSSDGKSIFYLSDNGFIYNMDLNGNIITSESWEKVLKTSNKVILYRKGSDFLVSDYSIVNFWDPGNKYTNAINGHKSIVWSGNISPDSNRFVTASNDGSAKIWDISGNCLATLTGHKAPVTSALYSHNGHYILTISLDRTAKLWDNNGNFLVSFSGHGGGLCFASFSHNDDLILTASIDKTGKLWNLSGKCLATLSGHRSQLMTADFSPDDRYILTTSNDKTARIWNKSGICVGIIRDLSNFPYGSGFTKDGNQVVTISYENKPKSWFIPSAIIRKLDTERIEVFSPLEKEEIDELDRFEKLKHTTNKSLLIGYSNYYLEKADTASAIMVLERIVDLDRKSIYRKKLGDIYRKSGLSDKYSVLYKDEIWEVYKDRINDIEDTCRDNNFTGKLNIYSVKGKLYENLLKLSSENQYKYEAARNYSMISFNAFLCGEFSLAYSSAERGIELDSINEDLYALRILHFLYYKNYDNARSFYQSNKNKLFLEKSLDDALILNFKEIEKAQPFGMNVTELKQTIESWNKEDYFNSNRIKSLYKLKE